MQTEGNDLRAYQTHRGDGQTHLVFEGETAEAGISTTYYVELQEVV
jgi:hypothetical protein